MAADDRKSFEESVTLVAEDEAATHERALQRPSTAPQSMPHSTDPTLGQLGGRYQLLALVGAGAMGSVYRARDAELEEIVALKMLKPELLGTAHVLDRFRMEVKLARRVAHPNVARVHDIGEHEGRKFLTMEFIEGESLGDLLARQGALPVESALAIAAGICAGVAAAHAAGVVHRDLKPDNVMMTNDGRPVVTDFGIARADVSAAEGGTQHGAVIGTPAYMAPEQVEGRADIDARADVYALGVLLFELFTGELPFTGESAYVVAARRLNEAPPDPRRFRAELPESLARLILKCMAREREQRFPSAAALGEALGAAAPTQLTGAVVPKLSPVPVEAKGERTVAVLPFRNAGTEDDAFVAEGLSEDLIDTLSMTRGLRVRPLGLVERFKGAVDPVEVGRQLGVEAVVSGSVRRRGETLRINARVMTVADGFQLWAERFERPAADALVVSDEVAQAIARALTVDAKTAPQRAAPTDPMAVELYLRGRTEARKAGQAPYQAAVRLFREAHQRAPQDPTFLSAYARACIRSSFFGAEEETDLVTHAEELTERALALAPDNPDTLLLAANIRFTQGDLSSAVLPLGRALSLAPGMPEAHELLGRITAEVGPPEEGIAAFRRAHELDPVLDAVTVELARTLALLGRWEEAESALSELTPSSRILQLSTQARFALWGRDIAPVVAGMSELQAESGPGPAQFALATIAVLSTGTMPPGLKEGFHAAVALGGRPARFRTLILQLAAEISAVAKDEGALDLLEAAADHGLTDLLWLEKAPSLRSLRGEPRFRAVLARVADRAFAVRAALSSVIG